MFEFAELAHGVTKIAYRREEPKLRAKLLDASAEISDIELALVAFKRFKITPEDWRNRKKWASYEAAVCDMVERTSTRVAPWTMVEANNKYYARIKVLRTLCQALERAMGHT